MERCLAEAAALDFPDEVRDGWLYGNAQAFFFGATPVAPTELAASPASASPKKAICLARMSPIWREQVLYIYIFKPPQRAKEPLHRGNVRGLRWKTS